MFKNRKIGFAPHFRITVLIVVIFLSLPFLVYANEKVCFPKACVDAQIAKDMPALVLGMDSRKSIQENEGMLFFLPPLSPATFGTKGMQFPVDIIWIDDHKKVMVIARDAAPCLEEACPLYIPPNEYAPYVLEVNAGYAQKHGIKVGEQVKF